MSTVGTAPSTGHRRSAAGNAFRHLITVQVFLALCFFGIVVAVAAVVLLVIDRTGEVSTSAVQFARQGAIWFPFAVAVTISTGYLPVHVAAGMTRRSFAVAAVAAALVSGALHALALTGLLQLERWIYGALGWRHTLDGDVAQVGEGIAGLLPGQLLTFVTAQLCGLLVGIVYYRAGGGWGTLALPLTVGPVLLVTAVLRGGAGLIDLSWLDGLAGALDLQTGAVALRAALCLAVMAVVAVAFAGIARGAVIAPTSA